MPMLRWVAPNLDETVTLFPEERGGLEMFVNLEKVGQSLMPLTRPGYQARDDSVSPATPEVPGAWTVLSPAAIPAKDPSGTPMIGKTESPIMTFGCHYNQLALTPKFDYFNEASIDEVAIWTRQLIKNKTHDETLYFLGGYVKDLEDITPDKFAAMLKSVDMSDPDQAAAAGSMSNKLMSNTQEETTDDTPPPAPAGGGGAGGAGGGGGGGGTPVTTSSPGSLSGGGGAAQLNDNS